MDRFDRPTCEGLAPEGSPERIEARRRLFLLAKRQRPMAFRSVDEWLAAVRHHAPELAVTVGTRDLEHIVRVAWGLR